MDKLETVETTSGSGNGGKIPVDIKTMRGNGGGDDSHEVMGIAVWAQLQVTAAKLGISLDMLFNTKRGHYVAEHIHAGRHAEACRVLQSMNMLDLRHYAPE